MTDAQAIRALQEQVATALSDYDAFMSGAELTARAEAIRQASIFAAVAYEKGFGGNEAHALARAFLVALIDPTSEDLDYLRADPSAGPVARDAADQQRAQEAQGGAE